MVEYRVVSCIGQIIIDTDIALLLLVIFILDEYRTSNAILVVHGSIQKSGLPEVTYYSASFLSPARCPNPKVYVEPWISLIDTSTLS
jgi:hypothetical protein